MAEKPTYVDNSALFYGTTDNTTSGRFMATSANKSKWFKNILRSDKESFKGMTPFLGGRGFFIPLYMPFFMETQFNLQTDLMKRLNMFYVKGINGFQDQSLTTVTIETGIEAQGIEIPSGTTGAVKELTFQYGPDFKGLFISNYMKMWQNGMSDPHTRVAHYHGAANMDFGQENHTMGGIYFICDPSMKYIEYTALCLNMMPKNAPAGGKDFTQGDNNVTEPAIVYSCQVFENNLSVHAALTAANILGYFATTNSAQVEFGKIATLNDSTGLEENTVDSNVFASMPKGPTV